MGGVRVKLAVGVAVLGVAATTAAAVARRPREAADVARRLRGGAGHLHGGLRVVQGDGRRRRVGAELRAALRRPGGRQPDAGAHPLRADRGPTAGSRCGRAAAPPTPGPAGTQAGPGVQQRHRDRDDHGRRGRGAGRARERSYGVRRAVAANAGGLVNLPTPTSTRRRTRAASWAGSSTTASGGAGAGAARGRGRRAPTARPHCRRGAPTRGGRPRARRRRAPPDCYGARYMTTWTSARCRSPP